MSSLEIAYFYFVTFVFGCIFGSFCNCMAERIVDHQNLVTQRSSCPDCGHVLSWKDLIPVLSWVSTGGKCRYCGKPISVRYPLTELVMGVLWIMTLQAHGLTIETLVCLAILCCLFIITLTDLDIKRVPEALIIASCAIWIFFHLNKWNNIFWGLGCAFALWLAGYIFSKVKNTEALGFGDVEMFFLVGLIGGQGCFVVILIASLTGIAFALLRKEKEVPFCPAISIAVYIYLLYGWQIFNAYMSLF